MKKFEEHLAEIFVRDGIILADRQGREYGFDSYDIKRERPFRFIFLEDNSSIDFSYRDLRRLRVISHSQPI